VSETSAAVAGPDLVRGLWQRQIDRYPDTTLRYTFLGIVVLATIVLYYELYINGAVAPSILQFYGMSFNYYVLILVFGNALGALASLVAGLADRWGRANLVAYGLLFTGAMTLFAFPNTSSGFLYGVFYAFTAIVEGMVLVATPALVRDYSPQVGRASAMGFWTLGPVIGSLVVTEVTSHTFTSPPPGVAGDWQGQYRICGVVGLIVWAVAFVGLRELSPKLRDQLMVSMHDRVLIEAKAKHLDLEAVEKHHWASVLKPNIAASAFGVSVFLIVYYTAVAFAVIYLVTVFTAFSGPSGQTDANNLLNWWWGAEAITLVVVGVVSDRLLVRKPFMVAGGVGTVVMTYVLINVTGHPDTGYGTLRIVVILLGLFISLSYAPWMAAFTETVEDLNPAATAAGLAIWGLIIRAVVSVSFLVIPHAVGSVTPIVDHGPVVQAAVAQVPPDLLVTVEQHQALFAKLASYPANQVPPDVLGQAVVELGGGAKALATLQGVQKYAAPLAVLSQFGPDVQAAQANAPSEWQHWLWICLGGQVVFIPLSVVLFGRWNPRKAREDEEEHERLVAKEMAALGLSAS
jgi:MFS family permease